MFVYAVKATRQQLLAIIFCGVLLIVMLVLAFRGSGSGSTATAAAPHVDDNAARLDYLRTLGYEADETPEVREVMIPDTFDELFASYNAVQQEVGMDLSPYHGKRMKLYTYTVKNFPDPAPVVAHLYVYKERVVGGDISAAAQGGFVKPLARLDAI